MLVGTTNLNTTLNLAYVLTDVVETLLYDLRSEMGKQGYELRHDAKRNFNTAIAALRDDTNENQWFVADSPLSVSYDDAVGNDHYFTEPKGSMFFWDINWMHATIISGNYHKATVEDLIGHFKEKEE